MLYTLIKHMGFDHLERAICIITENKLLNCLFIYEKPNCSFPHLSWRIICRKRNSCLADVFILFKTK